MKTKVVLEIGEQYLKLAMGRTQGPRQSRLLDLMVEPVSALKDEGLTKLIGGVFGKLKLKSQGLIISMPRNFVTVRNLHLPSKDKKEIAQMIDLHIPRIVPYRKEEVVFDHKFLGYDEMGYSKVILAIVQAEAIRRRSRALESIGMTIDMIDLSSYGTWQRIVNERRKELNDTDIYLALDIDSTYTDLIIFSHANLLFTRSIPVGANELEHEEALKRLLGDARQSMIIFYNEELNKKPVRAYLSTPSPIAELPKAIETELNMPVESMSAPYTQELLKTKSRSIPEGVSLNTVTEFAIADDTRALSLVLPELLIRKALKEKTRELTILGTMVVYLVTAALGIFLGRIYNEQTYLRLLAQHNAVIEQDIGDLVSQSRRIDFIKEFLSSRGMPLRLVHELGRLVGPEISINFASLDESGKIVLRGQGIQLSDVFKFVTAIEGSKYFKGVTTKYTRTKKVREREITDFEIGLQMV